MLLLDSSLSSGSVRPKILPYREMARKRYAYYDKRIIIPQVRDKCWSDINLNLDPLELNTLIQYHPQCLATAPVKEAYALQS